MGGSGNSLFGSALDNVFPRVPPFFGLLTQQADLLVQSYSAMVEFLQTGDKAKSAMLVKLDEQAEEMKQKHLTILNNAFSTPMDREDVYRSISTIDNPVSSARIIVEEMETLGIQADAYIVEMATTLRDAASAIQRGYRLLDAAPVKAEGDATAASQCRLVVDKTYRRALASLYSADALMKKLKERTPDAEVEAMGFVLEILKRREIYRHLHVAARDMSDTGTVLHDIVIQLT
ncbi:MAG: DUF47 family protein [Magnetococcales bacterium]|nr:DUF47 family protein [Magnetococcales bacterium]